MQSGHLEGGLRSTALPAARRRGAWREREFWLLVLLVLGLYFTRLSDLTIRGEESRWARVAQEMIDSGDWIVPRQQGRPFPDRPPLNSWAIIAASKLTGEMDLVAIRLPTVLATLFTTLAIFVYSRNFLPRLGAFGAAAAFCTMGQVMLLGRVAESDALLTLCLAVALFAWHYGYACLGSPRLAWIAGYGLAALAGLAKGPQGPVYFIAITTVFLACRRDWQFLLNRWHAIGLCGFVLIIGAWQVPFALALGADDAGAVWSEGGDLAVRFHYHGLARTLEHWVSYPVEVLVCLMPWSLLLPVATTRWFWRNLREARPMAMFMLTACAVAFPTCWLPASTRTRYFMSLYPCFAPVIGLIIQRCWEAPQVGWWPRSWDRFVLSAAGCVGAAGLSLGLVHAFGGARWFAIGDAVSTGFAVAYVAASILAVVAIYWSLRGRDSRRAPAGVLALAAFVGLSYTGIAMNLQVRTSNDPSAAIDALRQMLPPGERLVSFDPVHHLFAYYFREPIELQKISDREVPAETDVTYFCFAEDPTVGRLEIPFAWDPIATISCERVRTKTPLTKVIVGKRRVTSENARVHQRAMPDEDGDYPQLARSKPKRNSKTRTKGKGPRSAETRPVVRQIQWALVMESRLRQQNRHS